MKTLTTRTPETRRHPHRRPDSPSTNKLFYRIQEAAHLTGLKPSVLRYWETEFRELRPEKDASDQRRYRQADLEVIRAIRKLLYEDRFTIKGARGRLREELRRMRQAAAEPQPVAPSPNRAAEPKAAEPQRPSLTEFRTRAASAPADPRKRHLNQSLHNLRSELNALLSMLS